MGRLYPSVCRTCRSLDLYTLVREGGFIGLQQCLKIGLMSPDFEVSANLRFWPVLEIATFELLAENRPFGIAQRHQFKCNGHSPLVADSTSTRGCPKAAARVISTRSRNPWLDFSLFRNFQRVIHLDAEVSDRTFQFGMAKQ